MRQLNEARRVGHRTHRRASRGAAHTRAPAPGTQVHARVTVSRTPPTPLTPPQAAPSHAHLTHRVACTAPNTRHTPPTCHVPHARNRGTRAGWRGYYPHAPAATTRDVDSRCVAAAWSAATRGTALPWLRTDCREKQHKGAQDTHGKVGVDHRRCCSAPGRAASGAYVYTHRAQQLING
jgi:hypothetical protein